MRKRAVKNPKSTVPAKTTEFKLLKNLLPKDWWIALSLIAIFLLVLFLNSYFNIVSGEPFNPNGEGLSKYYLSGPDPYYNMRLVQQTLYGDKPGYYPYYSYGDPLLNYPLGRSGGRPPLMNMLAIAFSRLLTPFMSEIDALGYSMQFLPALFGALIVFPVYVIGKTAFGRKEGLLAALFIPLIPIHLGSGHGSAYTLFDHDSLNLLFFFLTYTFLIKSFKESDKTKSILYALLGGMSLAGLSMVWVEAKFLYVVILAYTIVQIFVDIYRSKIDLQVAGSSFLVLFTGYIVSLPVISAKYGIVMNTQLLTIIGAAIFGFICYILIRHRMPWTLSIPLILLVIIAGLIFLYFVPTLSEIFPPLAHLKDIWGIIYGGGVYAKKVSQTIAEANVYGISRTVMSFGPALYWMAWVGFLLISYRFIRYSQRKDHLLLIVIFLIEMWLSATAGRFLNDLVPLVALFSSYFTWYILDKINYPEMVKVLRNVGGGLHGLRRAVKFMHIFGILLIALIIILPNAYLSLDAAVPYTEKKKVFGDLPNGAFFTGLGKEGYWIDAYTWLSSQDTDIEDSAERPAFISWWDYGFYEVATGGHPTVADNFQDGIPAAANFHTATSEEEAVSIWIIRLLEGNAFHHNGRLTESVKTVLEDHLGRNDSSKIIQWVEHPKESPTYGHPIAFAYNHKIAKNHPVGEQWPMNAVYHDVSDLLTAKLDDEGITWLYHDLQRVTGKSIRYYGVEGYDKQIFNIFSFLADKSLILVAMREGDVPEDDFIQIKFVTQTGRELTYDEWNDRTPAESRQDPVVQTKTVYKDAYFNTMFYKTYIGVVTEESSGTYGGSKVKTEPDYQLPCLNMRHFYAEYISPYPKYVYYQGNPGKTAVVIAKYYEGAYINGTILFEGKPQDLQVVVRKNVSLYGGSIPIDHDKDIAINGSFHVIAPAGNISLQVRRYPELGINAFAITNVTFNSRNDTSLAPITEDEAMRNSDNFTRFITIEIKPGTIKGYVYDERGNESGYNSSIDQPLANAEVVIRGIESFNNQTMQVEEYDNGMIREVETDANGSYIISGLLPGIYQLAVLTPDGFQIENTLVRVPEGNTTHDVVLPKPGNVSGVIYFDENDNEKYDPGEEMEGVTVSLIYTTTPTHKMVISLVTNATGRYSFTSLIPGDYQINATLPGYVGVENITIEANKTKLVNVSIDYLPVNVTGATIDQQMMDNIGNISIAFVPDRSIENNTARFSSARSNETGYYSVLLRPGTYNVSVKQPVNVSGQLVTYIYSGHLVVNIGEGMKTFDILLAREE